MRAGGRRGKELSYSSFHTYEECPQRWKFLYVDGLEEAQRSYFSFGRSMHLALEAFVAPMVEGGASQRGQTSLLDFGGVPASQTPISVEELLELFKRVWVSEGYASADEEERYFLTGKDLLRRFHSAYTASIPKTIAVEKDLSGSMEGVKIHGIIDRIDLVNGETLDVLDYKTTRELSVQDAVASDQLTFYQFLAEQNYDKPVSSLTLYHLRSLKPLSSPPRDKKKKIEVTTRVGRVWDGMTAEKYEPAPGPQCRRCEFRSRCPVFNKG